MKHIFLTGNKQIGKSTIVRAVMKHHAGSMSGFLTYRTDSFQPPFYSVHYKILDPSFFESNTGPTPSGDNFLFFCRADSALLRQAHAFQHIPAGLSPREWTIHQFNELGQRAILPATGDLMILDELGPHEQDAHDFQKCLLHALNKGSIPIFGVIQDGSYPLFDLIAHHPQVRLIRVTEDNRDTLRHSLLLFEQEKNSTPSYGAVVIEQSPAGPAVLMISGYKGLSFPKGHMEEGELPHETAIREVREETGISISVDVSFYRTVKSARPQENRSITFFPGKSINGIIPPIPQPGEISRALWVPVDKAASYIRHEPDRRVFEDIIAYLRNPS